LFSISLDRKHSEYSPKQNIYYKYTNTDEIGGIDLNAKNLNLQTHGQKIDFKISPDVQAILNDSTIEGFMPVIIQIIPADIFHCAQIAAEFTVGYYNERNRDHQAQFLEDCPFRCNRSRFLISF
jgi:hypothetical protein